MTEPRPLTHEELVHFHMARGMTRREAEAKLAAEQTLAATDEQIQQIRAQIAKYA